jgi:SUKH superfamily protein
VNPTAWRGRLAAFGDAVRFAPPASAAALGSLADALGLALPDELRSLLAESDGLADRYGASVVWPASEMARQNREFRTDRDFRRLYMPFDALLFFGQAGNGDQFFYRILDGQVRAPDIYLCDHETDSRTWTAASLAAFLPSILREPPDD